MPAIANATWYDVYHRCRSIHEMGSPFRDILSSWGPPATVRARCAEYRTAGFDVPTDIEDDVIAVHDRLRTERPDPHYQDVFHAASYILVIPLVTYTRRLLEPGDLSRYPYVHRGQRNSAWLVAPNVLRPTRGSNEVVTPDLASARLRRTGEFMRRLRALRPELDDAHAAAIAQHYSKEAQLHTWLVDMTTDPFVALWFASLGGVDGDIGIVESIYLPDWNEVADIPGKPLGPAKLIFPTGVPRIAAQHGLFLEAPSGAFWPQNTNQVITFRQHTGLTFEDPAIGVTMTVLMPKDDELRRFADAFAAEAEVPATMLGAEPQLITQLFVDFTVAAPYYSLAREVAGKWHPVISTSLDVMLCNIAWFHGTLLLPPWSETLMASRHWSMRRFVEAVEYAALNALNGTTQSWQEVVERAVFDLTAVRDEVRAAEAEAARRYVAC